VRDTAFTANAVAGTTGFFLITTGQGAAGMLKAMNDGTNGTPRTGLNNRDSVLGTQWGLTY
ncbi:MAG TPA: hypothetical protein PKY31_09250, partial [Spirochaetota bacterium]|nr:hypothetical protein [Spirochaetota bacterium]